MRTFTDNNGREWVLDLNIESARRINPLLEAEKANLLQPNTLIHRLADPFFTANVLYIFCKKQADDLAIDSAEFGRSLGGLALWTGQQMLIEEYIDFFPDPNVQDGIRKLSKKTLDCSERIRKSIEKRMEAMDSGFNQALQQMETALDNHIEKQMTNLGGSFTKSAELQGSATSESTHSANSAILQSDGNGPNGTEQPPSLPPSSTADSDKKKPSGRKSSTPTPETEVENAEA